jgi:hypothetical protein
MYWWQEDTKMKGANPVCLALTYIKVSDSHGTSASYFFRVPKFHLPTSALDPR